MAKLKILLVLGTAREGRFSERVAVAVFNELQKRGDVEPVLADVKDHTFGATIDGGKDDPRLLPWKELVKSAHGLFIVTPEYNHGYPGELKMLLDGAFEEYADKPVAICGVSNGGFGGARVIEQVRGLVAYLRMIPVFPNVNVANVNKTFTAEGTTADMSFYEKVNAAADSIIAYSKLMSKK